MKNSNDNIECNRAFYQKHNSQTIIMCSTDYHLVCNHAKYCSICGHFILKNSAMMCPKNDKGNYIEYKKNTSSISKKITPKSNCGCK